MEINLQTITCSWRRTILFPQNCGSDPHPCQHSRSMEGSVKVNVAQEKVSSLVGINAIFFAINDQWHQAMQLKYNYLTHTCRAYLLHLTYALFLYLNNMLIQLHKLMTLSSSIFHCESNWAFKLLKNQYKFIISYHIIISYIY